MEKVKPITPDDMIEEIPDWVIDGINRCIKEHWVELDKKSQFTQDELIDFIKRSYAKYFPEEEINESSFRRKLFDKHYLDIEPVYREAGWNVDYEEPEKDDTASAIITFSSTPQE